MHVPITGSEQAPQELTGRAGRPFTKTPHPQREKRCNGVLHSKGGGKKCGESPGAKFSGDLKTHLRCLAILHFLTLIFITVWWGVVLGICVFPAQSKNPAQVRAGKGVTDEFAGAYKSQ